MNTDIRIATGLTSNPKTIKLMRRCGDRAFFCLINLWTWVSQNRPEGILEGMDDEDVEIASKWEGEPGKFVKELVAIRLLDVVKGDDVYSLHDWEEHNPWASKSEDRSDSARLSRLARKNPEIASELKKQGRTGITAEEYRQFESGTNRSTTVQRPKYESGTNRSTPAPAPAPTPNVIKEEDDKSSSVGQGSPTALANENPPPFFQKTTPVPYCEIIGYLNEKLGTQYKPEAQLARRHIKARWNEGHRVDDFKTVIDSRHEMWAGDPGMNQYLRPETLFNGKFDGYLQYARAAPVKVATATGEGSEKDKAMLAALLEKQAARKKQRETQNA